MSKPLLYLASASPRRRELLTQVGLPHLCLAQDLDESMRERETPAAYVERLAREKARSALQDPARLENLPVLAADTTVVSAGISLGKPSDEAQAFVMLRALSGTTHEVLTGVAVVGSGVTESIVVTTRVSFRDISDEEIAAYWASGEPRDKAGAYAIQGRGAIFISAISGSYTNVVGLPLFETMQLLVRHGITSTSVLRGGSA